jgi:hypothetical protein
MARINFNPSAVELPEDKYTSKYDIPVPDGSYLAEIVDQDEKENSKKSGRFVHVKWEIAEGEHLGRWVPEWINYIHESEVTQRIGEQQLKKLCDAIGIDGLADTDQMQGLRAIITVGTDKKDSSRNVVVAYEPVQNSAPAPAQKSDTEATTSRPWNR